MYVFYSRICTHTRSKAPSAHSLFFHTHADRCSHTLLLFNGQNCNTHQCLRSSMNEYGVVKSHNVDWMVLVVVNAWILSVTRLYAVRKLPDGNGYDFQIEIMFAHILHICEVYRNSSCFVAHTHTHTTSRSQ